MQTYTDTNIVRQTQRYNQTDIDTDTDTDSHTHRHIYRHRHRHRSTCHRHRRRHAPTGRLVQQGEELVEVGGGGEDDAVGGGDLGRSGSVLHQAVDEVDPVKLQHTRSFPSPSPPLHPLHKFTSVQNGINALGKANNRYTSSPGSSPVGLFTSFSRRDC